MYFIFSDVIEVAKCILLPCYFAFFFEGICFGVLVVPISDFLHLQRSSPICCTSALPNKTGSSTVTVSSSSGLHIGVYTGFSGISRGRLCRCILSYRYTVTPQKPWVNLYSCSAHLYTHAWCDVGRRPVYVRAPVLLWWMSHFGPGVVDVHLLVLTGLQHP